MCHKDQWVLVVVDVKEKRIQHYADVCMHGVTTTTQVFLYLQEMHKHLLGADLPELETWRARIVTHVNLAQASANGSDCGLFICQVAFHLVQNQTVVVSQNDLTALRRGLWEEIEAVFLEEAED